MSNSALHNLIAVTERQEETGKCVEKKQDRDGGEGVFFTI